MTRDWRLNWPVTVLERVLRATRTGAASESRTIGVILCAGVGQRMAPLTKKAPKPALPVLNCPMVWWSLARISGVVGQVRINTHYLSAAFAPLEAITRDAGISFSSIYEPHLTGPVGGVVACCGRPESSYDVLVLVGDAYYEADFASLLRTHRTSEADVTMGVARVNDSSRYGVLAVDAEGRVTGMSEKPKDAGPTNNASCGIYILSSAVFAKYLDQSVPLDWVDFVERLVTSSSNVRAARIDGWWDAGTPEDLLKLNLAMMTDKKLALVSSRSTNYSASVWLQSDASISATAQFGGKVLVGPGSLVDAGVSLHNVIVGTGARVRRGATVANAVILPGAEVPANKQVSNMVWS